MSVTRAAGTPRGSDRPLLTFSILPWHSLNYPCLASGILSSVARSLSSRLDVAQVYTNLRWAKYLSSVTDGAFSIADYALLCDEYVYCLAGEWAFSSSLHGQCEHGIERYRELFSGPSSDFEKVLLAHRHAPSFIEAIARELVDSGTNYLALSSTFTQNVACLALAAAVKRIAPQVVTILGGGNCDGPLGVSIHRNFPSIDYVVRGEGETALLQLLEALLSNQDDLDHVPNLCWRHDGITQVNAIGHVKSIGEVPTPEYDQYFEAIEDPEIRPYVQPSLVMETARGCWWGEKHHCTFCGLNGSSMQFRSKAETRAVDEIESLVTKYKSLDIIVTDNILDLGYLNSVIPTLRETGWDLRLQYEIKANIRRDQLSLMRSAGIVHIQPGIESLSSRVLRLMQKGITGCRNVQALRDMECENITVSWNYLFGFPGETDDDYVPIIRQFPNLYHIQPPRGGATRISLQRFSPYFDRSDLGFPERVAHAAYEVIYGLGAEKTEDIAFFFESPPAGISQSLGRQLSSAIAEWHAAYANGSQLWHSEHLDAVEVVDSRRPPNRVELVISGPLDTRIYALLGTAMSSKAVTLKVSKELSCWPEEVTQAVATLVGKGLIFEEGGQLVRLPTDPVPFRARN